MKYQDFFSDENFVSSGDTIFIFHMWRYPSCDGYFNSALANEIYKRYMPYCYNIQNTK